MQNKKFSVFQIMSLLVCVLFSGIALAEISDAAYATKTDFMRDFDFLHLCEDGSLQQINHAIRNGANVNFSFTGNTPLLYAARYNQNPKIITSLINAGANMNVRNQLGNTPLAEAIIYNKNTEVIIALINAGANVNTRDDFGDTPLNAAIRHNKNTEVIIALINAGANVNAKDEITRETLLEWVVMRENPDLKLITATINAGADVNVRSKSLSTPLMDVILFNPNPEVITALISAGADINAKSITGMTPLHNAVLAAIVGRLHTKFVILTLLKHGANPKAKDDSGKMPIDYARENVKFKKTEAYRLLEKVSR